MRSLIHLPIIHTEADLGSLAGEVRSRHIERMGEEGWQARARKIEQFWYLLRHKVEQLNLDYSQVRLYQDGLPLCDREVEIVVNLAKGGSHNHRLLLFLMERGASLMGTESPDLLLAEYSLIKQSISSDTPNPEEVSSQSLKILEKRDRFIASRINETLLKGETGLLFLGMLHDFPKWLAPDIEIRRS